MFKRFLCILLTIAVLVTLVSCKEDYTHCELTLRLTEDFKREENSDFDLFYSNGIAAVALVRMSFSAALLQDVPDYLTAYEFGLLWLDQCDREAEMISTPEVDYCTYYETANGRKYFYLASFYRSQYAYFTVLYCVDSSMENEWSEKFLDFAKTAYFNSFVE